MPTGGISYSNRVAGRIGPPGPHTMSRHAVESRGVADLNWLGKGPSTERGSVATLPHEAAGQAMHGASWGGVREDGGNGRSGRRIGRYALHGLLGGLKRKRQRKRNPERDSPSHSEQTANSTAGGD